MKTLRHGIASIGKLLSCHLFITICSVSATSAQVSVNSIEVLEERFSSKLLKINLEYDGTFGEFIKMGIMPSTSREVERDDYYIHTLRPGIHDLEMTLFRPNIGDNGQVDSWGIHFFISYNNDEDKTVEVVTHDLEWKSIEGYYGISSESAPVLRSITRFEIDESLYNANQLLAWFGQRSTRLDDISISYTREPEGFAPQPSLTQINAMEVAEDIDYSDFHQLVTKMYELKVPINSVRIVKVDELGYFRGKISIGPRGKMLLPDSIPDPMAIIANSKSEVDTYQFLNFTPTPREEFTQHVLNQIIALNDQDNHRSSEQARELATYLVEKDPDSPRAYVELARAMIKETHSDDGLAPARNVMKLASELFPEDSYVTHYTGFIEFRYEEFEKAIAYFRLADQQKETNNIWLVTNWASALFELNRPDEAFEKFAELQSIEVSTRTDKRAMYRGLAAFAERLVEYRKPGAEPIYDRMIAEFPEHAQCVPVDYAQYLLFNSGDINKSLAILGRSEQNHCDDYSAVAALVDVYTWHQNQGSRAELYRSFLKHAAIDELVYKIANSSNPVPLLTAMHANGVDLDQQDRHGVSPLYKAIEDSNPYAVESLAQAGANIHEASEYGFTPLMLAMFNEDAAVIRALINAGADPLDKANVGFSALDMARELGNLEILTILSGSQTTGV